MSDVRLFLFDDRRARRWAPFTLTRPVGELLFGSMTLRERTEHVLGVPCEGHISRAALVGFDEPGAAPTMLGTSVPTDGVRILLSSRAALDFQSVDISTVPARIVVNGEPAGWVLPDGQPAPEEDALRDPASVVDDTPVLSLEGVVLGHAWDLIAQNDDRIRKDGDELWTYDSDAPGIIRIGSGTLSLAPGAEIEPGVHVDLRDGPVRLEAGARIEGPARISGPLHLGPDSTVLGGVVGNSTIGPVCLVRGEVTHSVFLGYVNKAHDGHIGHAMVGRWVNLGAFTTNSDLKNNYGNVRVWTLEGEKDTGLMKVGCFLGDHVKTGIGTVINTGTVIGAGSNVFGGVMPPTVVPPFCWGAGKDFRDHRLEKFLATASRAMARRKQKLTPGVTEILRTAWARTAGRRAE